MTYFFNCVVRSSRREWKEGGGTREHEFTSASDAYCDQQVWRTFCIGTTVQAIAKRRKKGGTPDWLNEAFAFRKHGCENEANEGVDMRSMSY